MISLKLREETLARQAPAKTCLLPHRLNPNGFAVKRNINLVTGRDSQTVAHRFRDHHLPLGANTVSHTGEYNLRRVLDSRSERNASPLPQHSELGLGPK